MNNELIHEKVIIETTDNCFSLTTIPIDNPHRLMGWMSRTLKRTENFDNLMTFDNVYNKKFCTRHDYSNFFYTYMNQLEYDCGRLLVYTEPNHNDFTITWYTINNNYYWLDIFTTTDNIRGPFKSLDDLKSNVFYTYNNVYKSDNNTIIGEVKTIYPDMSVHEYVSESNIINKFTSSNDIVMESLMDRGKKKHHMIFDDEYGDPVTLIYDDFLDNYINVNPYKLDINTLEQIKKSDNIVGEFRKYMLDMNKAFEDSMKRSDYFNASIYMIHCKINNQSTASNKEIISVLDKMFPSMKSNKELIDWLEIRINELRYTIEMLDKLMVAILIKYGASCVEANKKIKELNISDKDKILQNIVYSDKFNIIDEGRHYRNYDFSVFGGGMVYISEGAINSVEDKEERAGYLNPSKYLICALKYDAILVTHEIEDRSNKRWRIQPVHIDDEDYYYIDDVIKVLHKKQCKGILLIVCNTGKHKLDKYKKLYGIDIEYGDRFIKNKKGDTLGTSVLFEYNQALTIKNIESVYEEDLYKTQKYIKNLEKAIIYMMQRSEMCTYPEKFDIIRIGNTIKVENVKCNSIGDFYKVWDICFNDVLMLYKTLVYNENIVYREYLRCKNKYTLNESTYSWTANIPGALVFFTTNIDNSYYKFNTLKECMFDIIQHYNIKHDNDMVYRITKNDKEYKKFKITDIYEQMNHPYHTGNFDNEMLLSLSEELDPYLNTNNDLRLSTFENREIVEEDMIIDGDSIIFAINPRKSFMDQYDEIHKVLHADYKNNNIDGMKHNLGLMFSLILFIERSKKYKNRDKEAVKARAFAINDFKTYLKIVQKEDKNFDFMSFYEENHYGKTIININSETIKALKQLFKSIIL